MKRQNASYGQAGGRGQGQPYSRFQIDGDPTPFIPIWAAGPMSTTVPAHLIGGDGAAYFYGTTKVGGITNMISNGEVLRSVIVDQATRLNSNNVRLLLGGGVFDGIATTSQVAVKNFEINASNPALEPVIVNGEFAFRDTTTTQYGAVTEQFTVAGTVTATTGSPNIVGAGTAFTTAALTGPYAYTPSFNAPRSGDLLEVIQAGVSQYYRIVTITDATHLSIFPNYQNTGGAGLTYKIHRTGYGSWSRNERLLPQAVIVYYAGNSFGPNNPGTIEAVNVGTGAHFMAPQSSGSVDLVANDVVYYKSFLLYGGNSAISWSVAGFPTAIATAFGATDFPAQNISVVALDDVFVSFEFLGDQLIAIFKNSMYLVQATGIVPEFAFYRLAEPTGAYQRIISDPQDGQFASTRSTASVRNGAVYMSQEGVQRLDGGLANPISKPVDTWDWPSVTTGDYVTTWDSGTNSVSITNGTVGRYLVYDCEQKTWVTIDLSAINARGLTGGIRQEASSFTPYRQYSYGYWVPSGATFLLSQTTERDTTAFSPCPWKWATPIIDLGQVYSGFTAGGFIPWCRGSVGAPADGSVTLSWSIYGGADPYHMTLRQGPVPYDYVTGFQNSRNVLGIQIDDPFIGFVLTGNFWIELAGIMLYPSDNPSRA
jgi:hypothetical protein